MAIYFDNSATTQVDKRVLDKMIPYFVERYGNPSSVHLVGRSVRADFDNARGEVAKLIRSSPDEIIFTGSGTESDNIAIKQTAHAMRHKGKHIITSSIEHKAVLETCVSLEKMGYELTYLPVDKNGVINLDELKRAIRNDTTLISIMLVNNEIGSIQPIKEVVEIAHDKGIYVHTDAVQAVGKMHVDVSELGVDMLTFSGHKIYAPKGIGVLYIDKELKEKLEPLINGGMQESGLRAGTENIPSIIGLGEACRIITNELDDEIKRISTIRNRFEDRILSEIPETYVNGGERANRICSISDITFRYIEGEALMVYAGEVCSSSGSACTSASSAPSHVLQAIGIDEVDFHGALRFSFGRFNTIDEADKAVDILKVAVAKLRMMSPLYNKGRG